jgi:uncharacterized membrane protein YebE (DUF533 family)
VEEGLSHAEALVAVAMCAAYADGSMDAEEADEFAEELQFCRALESLDESALREAMMKVDAIARKHGDEALLARAAAALPAELRPTAFYLAVDLVVADDEVASEERGFLAALGKTLGVPDSLAAQILDVVSMRKRA